MDYSWSGLDSDQLLFALQKILQPTAVKSFDVIAANQMSLIIANNRYPKAIISNTDPSNMPGESLSPPRELKTFFLNLIFSIQ